MKAAYHHPGITRERTSAWTPMRAALDSAGIDVVDVKDGGRADSPTRDRDILADSKMARRFADIDVWISEACESGATDKSGPYVCNELGVPFVAVEPDTKIAANDFRDAALQIIGQSKHIVTTSSAMARYIEKLKLGNLTLLPTFIDVGPFRAAYKIREIHKSRLASRLRLPETSPWLLTDGMMEVGDSLQSYEVTAVALSRIVMMDWKLIVVASGSASAEAKERMLRLPSDRIRYCEPMSLPDFAALCVSSDLYVWPAIGDSHPGSLLEAQSSGLPVIAGRKDSTVDRVIDGQTGRLTPIGNVESFANAISFLLRHRDFLRSFSDSAIDTAATNHDLDTAAASLRNVLAELC